MARSYPIRTPRYPTSINHHHRSLFGSIHAIQLPRNGLDLFRALRDIQYALRVFVYAWFEIALGKLGFGCGFQRHSVLALPVSRYSLRSHELTGSASYLLILTYDKSAAAADHITLTHFLGSLINPVPSISKSRHIFSGKVADKQSERSWFR
jgi:hypothetical protein